MYPELELLPDDKTRIHVLNHRQGLMLRSYRSWLAFGVYLLLNTMVVWFLPHILGRVARGIVPAGLVIFLAFAFVIVGVASGIQFFWRGPIRRGIRKELISRGIPICIECGYDLRGQTEPRCPECGRHFERMPGNP